MTLCSCFSVNKFGRVSFSLSFYHSLLYKIIMNFSETLTYRIENLDNYFMLKLFWGISFNKRNNKLEIGTL